MDRFINQLNHSLFDRGQLSQVRKLAAPSLTDPSFIAVDSTSFMANTSQNNPKSFRKNKFTKDNQPKSVPDCTLGVHTATNQINERNYEFHWDYKSHILLDCNTEHPIVEIFPAKVANNTIVEEFLT